MKHDPLAYRPYVCTEIETGYIGFWLLQFPPVAPPGWRSMKMARPGDYEKACRHNTALKVKRGEHVPA